MNEFGHLLIDRQSSIHKAIEKLDNNDAHIVLVVDIDNKLLGTITDGDVRRGILRGIDLNASVTQIMNPQPIVVQTSDSKEKIFSLMKKNSIRQIPILNDIGQLVGVEILEDVINFNRKDNTVVLMAGGLSTRLRPLTENMPKPMLKVGGKPILENILTNLIQSGFHRFYISINYLGEQIKDYFGDGSRWDVSIDYIHEDKPLGTAGALGFLDQKENIPIIVMNGDLFTTIKINNVLDFHFKNLSDCTVCIRDFDYQLPYGIVEIQNQKIIGIKEKPTYKYFVNAGMYIINSDLLSLIPKNECYQMPDFLEKLINLNYKVEGFPLMEYWSDIGQLQDYEKTCREFEEVMF